MTEQVQPLTLQDLGWSETFQEQLDRIDEPGLLCARVVIEYQDRYELLATTGPLQAQLSGNLRHEASEDRLRRPAVGDWVAVQPPDSDSMATIVHLFERKTRFVRQAAGRRAEVQVVAANIDALFLVTSFIEDFNPRRIERYLATASESGARPIIVLNKADLCSDPQPYIDQVVAAAPGIPIVVVSAARQDSLDELRRHIGPGETIALVGSSGVGKSTLVNLLLGREVQRVGAVRAHDGRGRHTTTHRELIAMPGRGILIDTPGMRELKLWTEGQGVQEAFADVTALAEQCRFRDCQHSGEPGCAVQAALRAGELDGARFASYQKLLQEQQKQQSQQSGRRTGSTDGRPPRVGRSGKGPRRAQVD